MPENPSIDLSRYRTQELTERIVSILSVPESLRTVASTTRLALVAAVVANALLFAAGGGAMLPWLLTTVYAILGAVVLGATLGLLRVATSLLTRSQDALGLMLDTSRDIASDYRQVQTGEKRMPPAPDIVEHVYDTVVLPTIETTVSKSLGIVGPPLLWTYRCTLGGCVRYLIKRMKIESLSREDQDKVVSKAEGVFGELEGNAAGIEAALASADGYVSYATSMLRKFILLPLQVLFVAVATVAVIPILVVWYLPR